MLAIQPVIYTPRDPEFAMSQNLITQYDDKARHLTVRPAIYLLARSPLSPVSRMIWTNLKYFSERNCDVFAIFHKRQHKNAALQAVRLYRDQFGDKVFDNVRLADFKEARGMFEELQMGSLIAWSGDRLSNPKGADITEDAIEFDVSVSDLAIFKKSFGTLWAHAPSFAESLGIYKEEEQVDLQKA